MKQPRDRSREREDNGTGSGWDRRAGPGLTPNAGISGDHNAGISGDHEVTGRTSWCAQVRVWPSHRLSRSCWWEGLFAGGEICLLVIGPKPLVLIGEGLGRLPAVTPLPAPEKNDPSRKPLSDFGLFPLI